MHKLPAVLAALFTSILIASSTFFGPRTVSLADPATSTPKPYLVLIVLDGARPDYFNVPGLTRVRDLIRHGTMYTNAWSGILASETPPGHLAIATGSEPRDGLIPSFSWANRLGQYQTIFNPTAIRSGTLEKIVRAAGVATIAGQVKKVDPGAKVVALGGYKYYANDALGGPRSDLTMYYGDVAKGFGPQYIPARPAPPRRLLTDPSLIAKHYQMPMGRGDNYAMKLAIKTFDLMHPRVLMMNLPEFDQPLGHQYAGPRDKKGVATLMHGFDTYLGKLEQAYRKAGVLDRTIFVVTADHGMEPISKRIRLGVIPNAVARAGGQIVYQNHSTAGYIWLKNHGRARASAKAIAALKLRTVQSVYYKKSVKGRYSYVRVSSSSLFRTPGMEKANQFLLNTFAGASSPDIAMLCREGTASSGNQKIAWIGDHGGADWQAEHIPLIISGPGVQQGVVSPFSARLIDVAPTILTLMGAPIGRMRGIPLADALRSPSPAALSAQASEDKVLAPVVESLKQESQLELAKH